MGKHAQNNNSEKVIHIIHNLEIHIGMGMGAISKKTFVWYNRKTVAAQRISARVKEL